MVRNQVNLSGLANMGIVSSKDISNVKVAD